MNFDEFFQIATQNKIPFPYQNRLATGDDLPDLIDVPTGAGKTAAVVLGWLWRLHFAKKSIRERTPRRLAYCLPMRVLVEQTRDEAKKWVEKLDLSVSVQTLMGGEDAEDWDLEPEKPAILIGTQDMLLSRALNRGYGMSRHRWPMHFGLLNNDCLWVLDEIQLMGVGLATSAQLQGFRDQERFRPFGGVKTIWMSATLRPDWLGTVDFRERLPQLTTLRLEDDDYAAPGLGERWEAKKPIAFTGLGEGEPEKVASFIKKSHLLGSLTLVVVNRVDRARRLFEEVRKLYQPGRTKVRGKKSGQPNDTPGDLPDFKLVHSRFRPTEREDWMAWLKPKKPLPAEGRIVISTQIVEAGLDISARTLITELAPWPSLVQRFGRCNRRGEFTTDEPAQIFWIDVRAKDDKQAAPYPKSELYEAREHLKKLADGGPKSLHGFFESLSNEDRATLFPFNPPHVLRRKDFVDLFDTTPDLAGNDVDVSRFIREGNELDVQVFWRRDPPPPKLKPKEARQIAPGREELCPVPVGSFREFIEKARKVAYRWDSLDGKWVKATPDAVFPGQLFWVPTDQGGYSRELGWDPKAPWVDNPPAPTPGEKADSRTSEPEYDSDLLSMFDWKSIAEHTDDVMAELKVIAECFHFADVPWDAVRVAGRWHDWGKAHHVFQNAIQDDPQGEGKRPSQRAGQRDIAKASEGFWRRYERKHFRHELASAIGVLTLLRQGAVPQDWARLSPEHQNLALYLIAAHHGKVRLSIRSMPDEVKPKDPNLLFARGIHQNDPLPGVDLGEDVKTPVVPLDLSPMKLGRGKDGSPSWAERVLGLRDHADIGPLRLAFLETLLRAADMRASRDADKKATVNRG